MRKAFYIMLAVAALYKLKMNIEPRKAIVEVEEEAGIPKAKARRSPASMLIKQTLFRQEPYAPQNYVNNYQENNQNDFPQPVQEEPMATPEAAPVSASVEADSETPYNISEASDNGDDLDEVADSKNSDKLFEAAAPSAIRGGLLPSLGPGFSGGGLIGGTVGGSTSGGGDDDDDIDIVVDGPPNGSPSGSPSENLSCVADTASGSFIEPISVNLSCNKASTITYCLSSSSVCCDPVASGIPYTGPISVGTNATAYCLSYSGKSGVEMVDDILNYEFNPEMPDLDVELARTQYQTTELPSFPVEITSTFFGSDMHALGILTFKANDPVALGMDCEEQISSITATSGVIPTEILSPLLLTSVNYGDTYYSTLFTTIELNYGSNFITSYVKNIHWNSISKCDSRKLTLMDFDYFQAETSHGDVGTNSVREYTGGFSAYGFFEAPLDINRLPAGTSTDPETDHELESGLLSVFF